MDRIHFCFFILMIFDFMQLKYPGTTSTRSGATMLDEVVPFPQMVFAGHEEKLSDSNLSKDRQ